MSPPTPKSTAAVVLAILVLILVGRSREESSAAAQLTFVFAQSADADTLDCPVTINYQSAEVCAQIFSRLVRTKRGSVELEPDLATGWSVSSDGLVWTFTLRDGVTFHDGVSWNSAAAKENVDRWADRNNPLLRFTESLHYHARRATAGIRELVQATKSLLRDRTFRINDVAETIVRWNEDMLADSI